MDRLDKIKLFLRVAEAGSFSKAARQLGLAQSTASKQIAELEQRLGVQLLRRTTRGLAITAAGQHYYDGAIQLVDELETLDEAVSEQERSPAGMVRVTSPPGFAASYLLPKLTAFSTRYPKLAIDFTVSQHLVNLVEERVDVAIRMGHLENSDLRFRQIGTATAIVVASTDYLDQHGAPSTPADLAGHACIASMALGKPRPWRFVRGPERISIDPRGSIRSDDVELTKAATKAGLGIAYAASWLFQDELASGRVRQLLTDYQCSAVPISAVWAGDRVLPGRTAAFIDFVADICASEPALRLQ